MHQGAAGGGGVQDPGRRRRGTLRAGPHGDRCQCGRQVGVHAAGRGRGGRPAEVPDADALLGDDDRVGAERPVGYPGGAHPQHGQQDLIQRAVGEVGFRGLRQDRPVGHPGHQCRVPAGPELAGGEHVGHQDAGAFGHQGEIGLVLDLLQAVQDQGGSRIPVDGKAPHFGQHAGIGRVAAVDRQLDLAARRIPADEPLDSPDLAGRPRDIADRDLQVRDPVRDLR